MVEAAIVTSVFMLLLFTIVQSAFVMRTYTSVRSASGDGARAAAVDSTDSPADYDVLQVVTRASTSLAQQSVLKVVVFKADSTSSPVPPACLTASVLGSCNTYTTSDLDRPITDFTNGFTAANGWPPSLRQASRTSGTDYVGVYVLAINSGATGPFPHQLAKTTIVPLEARST